MTKDEFGLYIFGTPDRRVLLLDDVSGNIVSCAAPHQIHLGDCYDLDVEQVDKTLHMDNCNVALLPDAYASFGTVGEENRFKLNLATRQRVPHGTLDSPQSLISMPLCNPEEVSFNKSF